MTIISQTTAMPIAVPSSIQSAPAIVAPVVSSSQSATKPVVHKKKKTWKKPADKPKRPLSAYNLFFQHERNRIVGDSPSGDANKRKHRKSHGKIGFESLAKTIANKWKTLDKASRRPFEQQAKREKAIYAQKLQAWHERRLARPSLEQILEQAYLVRPTPTVVAQQQPNTTATSAPAVAPTPVTPPAQPQPAVQHPRPQQMELPKPALALPQVVVSTTPIAIKQLAVPDIMDLSNPKAFFDKTPFPVAPMNMSLTSLLGGGATGGEDVSVLDSFDMPEIGSPSDDLSQMLNDDFIDFLSTMD